VSSDDDVMLANLQAEMVADHANGLLDRQLGRARKWMKMQKDAGGPVTLYAFTQHCMKEPSKRRHIIIAYCAAMWRLIHQEDT